MTPWSRIVPFSKAVYWFRCFCIPQETLFCGEVDQHCLLAGRLLQGILAWVLDDIKTPMTCYENTWPEELTALFRSLRMINYMV